MYSSGVTEPDRPLRVLFIHGLEGSPRGAKARYLAARFDAHTPAMDTSDLEGSIATQARAVRELAPDVVVGSSYGGAVAVALLARGAWRGPTVLLAPAAGRLDLGDALPEGVTVTVVHASRDAIIPREDSEALAATGTPGRVRLVVVDDEHRLDSLLAGDGLAELVREAATRGPVGGA